MTRSEAVLEIKRDAGYRATQDPAIISALQSAQRTLETGKTLPSWLVTFDSPIAVTAATPTVTLPDRFLRLHDEYNPYYLNSSGARVFIPRKNYTEAYQAYIASGFDENASIDTTHPYPSVFVLLNKTRAMVVPTPTTSFTMYLTFYQGAELLTTNIENAWLANAPDFLIGEATMMVGRTLRDKDLISIGQARRDRGGQSYLGDIIEDELAGRGLVMGRNN